LFFDEQILREETIDERKIDERETDRNETIGWTINSIRLIVDTHFVYKSSSSCYERKELIE